MNAKEARAIASTVIEKKYAEYFSKIKEAAEEGELSVEIRENLPDQLITELRSRDYLVKYHICSEITKISWI